MKAFIEKTQDCVNQMKIQGAFDEFVKYIEDFQLLRSDLWKRFVQQFREHADSEDAGWRGEYWGKMMRSASFVYSYSLNQKLYDLMKETVEDMLTTQDELGRISSYTVEKEFDGWDLWCRKYVLLGMEYFLEICKEEKLSERIIQSMCRQADYLIEKIGLPREGKLLITKATRNWRGLNSSSILEPIVKLYRLTKEQKYLDFADYIVYCGGTDVVNIFELAYEDQLYPYQYTTTKAYEMTSCFEGLLEYYKETGIEKYKQAVINFADKVLESDFTVIGSCGCTHELFDHSTVRQANTNMGKTMQETCVTVTIMKFFYRLNLLIGDAKYIDAFEKSFYNAYLGAINTEKVIEPSLLKDHPDWYIEALPFDSYSPLTAGTRGNGIGGLKLMSDQHYYGCCASIGALGLGMAARNFVLTKTEGIAVNLYFPGCVKTKTPAGKELEIVIDTEYPVNGTVKLTIKVEEPECFEVALRIPNWSKKTKIRVNEKEIELQEGYTAILREWKENDRIEAEFDMRTEILSPIPYGHQVLMNRMGGANYVVPAYDEEDPKAKYHVALRRGPVMLAQENRLGYNVDEPMPLPEETDGYAKVNFPEKETAPYKHLLELEVVLSNGKKIHVTDYASAGKLWTEKSKMAVWMLTDTVRKRS